MISQAELDILTFNTDGLWYNIKCKLKTLWYYKYYHLLYHKAGLVIYGCYTKFPYFAVNLHTKVCVYQFNPEFGFRKKSWNITN